MRSVPRKGAVGVLLLFLTADIQGAALWEGNASNDLNSMDNWVVDDNTTVHINPAGQNLQFYLPTPAHLTDIQVTADISAGSLSMTASAANNVTIGSVGGFKIRLTSSGIQSATTGNGTLTVNAGLITAPSNDVTWNIGSNVVLNGAIETELVSGRTRSINKTGAGALTLAGDNTNWGRAGEDLWLKVGTLNLNNANAVGLHRLVVGDPNGATAVTIDNTSGGAITLNTGGGQAWSDGFIFAGSNSLTMANNVVLTRGITANVQASTLGVNGVVSGGFLLSKAGAGTMTLNNNNTFGGGMILRLGTLNLGNAGANGTGTFTFGQGSGSSFTLDNTSGAAMTLANNNSIVLANGNTLNFTGTHDLNMGTGAVTLGDFTINVNAGSLTFGGSIANESGGKSLVKGGAGTLVLNGASSFGNATNGVDLNAGTLKVGHANALGVTGSLLRIFGGSLDVSGNSAITLANPNQRWADGWVFAGSQNLNMGTGTVNIGFATGSGVTVSVTQNTLTLDGVVTDTVNVNDGSTGRSLGKSGAGTLVLNNTADYTGVTAVSGGKLIVNGSVASSASTIVNLNGTLGGRGVVSAITGAGNVAPGNSAGILTAPGIDPSAGLDFTFELGQLGGPAYNNAAASGNDVLRLTGGSPVAGALDDDNSVDVLLNVASVSDGNTFRGGLFTDLQVDFLGSVAGGQFNYYILGNGSGTHTIDGVNYYTLAEFDPQFAIDITTVADTANFAGGPVSGQVMQFTVSVPEPAGLGVLAMGCLGVLKRRRR